MRVAIVVPVFCEEKNLERLYARLEGVISRLPHIEWRYLFVNDGSQDGSLEVLSALAQRDPKIQVLDLSRNFGKEIALSAGLHAADADAICCMDADLQHPPELIPDMIEAWNQGAEVVVAVRAGISRQPLLRTLGSRAYNWLMSRLSGLDMISGATDFRLLDRKIAAVFRRVTERERMFRSIVDWMGFRRSYVYFHADARTEGRTSFSYAKLWQLAITSITSFSLVPLRLTGYLGLTITLGSGALLMRMLWARFLTKPDLFTPLAIVVVINTFLMGIVLMAIGLVALYIGAIHTEVINRPLYIVRHRINFPAPILRERPEVVVSQQNLS